MDFEAIDAGDVDVIEEDDIFGEDNDVSQDQQSKKDAVIFLVDCRKAIFQGNPSLFGEIMSGFQSFLKSKIISNVDDKVGLIFFNVKNHLNGIQFEGIREIYKLDSPSADRIKECVKLEQQFETMCQFNNEKTCLNHVFQVCSSEFSGLTKDKFTSRIFLFTSEDMPYLKDGNTRNQIIQQARTLKDRDIQIELFPLKTDPNKEFVITKFYTEILTIDPDEVNNAVLDMSQKIFDLHQRIKQKEFRKRALNRLIMDIDDVKVGLKIYCLVNKAKKPTGKTVDRKTNDKVSKKTQSICVETGETLYQNQIGTYIPLGNEKIPFSKEQMNKVKSIEKPGMTLIGFKSIHTLKDYHNYRASYFLYPDDEHVNGSSQFFDALISQMIAKEKLAIVRLCPRQGSQVRFCALIAQQEKYDADHFQTPPGMHLIFLPYAEDIRQVVVKKEFAEPSRQMLNSAKIMVNALTLQDFDCSDFNDPAIQRFFAYLQGHALNEQNIDEPEDHIQANKEGMDKYRDIVDLYMKNVQLECAAEKPKAAGRGRGRGRGSKIEEETYTKNESEEEFYKPAPRKKK